jgi:RNA recognition motif-containing protein
MKLFVGNLSWDATEEGLKEMFETHGEVVSTRIVQDKYTGRSKGFGFIEMKDQASADAACQALNDVPFVGRPLRVSPARQEGERDASRPPRGPRNFGDARPQRRSFRPREESQY